MFVGDPRVLEHYKENGIYVIFKRTGKNETKLQYLLPKNSAKFEVSPEEVHEATPNGLMCMLVASISELI